ncbi:pre-peptidase C-terminal domain-containing protein [Azospirillum sp. A1-3]|uniref:pre-peptidase C-terminal domain-containing protein n=1 Tax=Azospirillum sp. A1-3 TaxID=185874 RepID=UPI002077490B|nr:pre-peptidase C-terminal domain-containing protein [Azospirillum sp. A1-3]MCM8735784.1 pre-peptidase C-terminal domain-containing protein [Azospirillum sp. A1-3]
MAGAQECELYDKASIDRSIQSIKGNGPNSLESLVNAGILNGNLSDAESRQAPSVALDTGTFDVFVEASLMPQIAGSLDVYATDLAAEGYDVSIRPWNGSAMELRDELHAQWEQSGLQGALFVGNIPHVDFTSEDNWGGASQTTYPHDLYFMDLDGTYILNEQGLDSHTGDVDCEIYVSRLSADNLQGIIAGSEADLINSYFQKVHNVRTGALQYEDRAIWFADDDWSPYVGDLQSLASLYSQVTDIRNPSETTLPRYIQALGENAETVIEQIHSWSAGHSVSGVDGGILTSQEVARIDKRFGFLNMFNCSSADYTTADNLIGAYVFGQGNVVNAVGSTKTGGMLNFADFYSPQSSLANMGQAFKDWFNANVAPTDAPSDDWKVDWFYGMTMQGDPTLRPALIPSQTVDVIEPNDTIQQAGDFTAELRQERKLSLNGFLGDNAGVESRPNEVDLVKFRLAPGQQVMIDTDAANAGVSNLDTILRIFDAQGSQLAYNDDSDGLDSRITFTAPEQGTYIIGVSGFANSNYDPNIAGSGSAGFGVGRYVLNVEALNQGRTDRVFGTAGDDVINLFDGSITVFGGAGNDLVDSSQSPGSNRLFGGAGNDELLAGSHDQLFGESGADVLNAVAGGGRNRLYGGPDGDVLFAGEADLLFGGDGADELFAGSGGSTMTGGAGDDLFWVTAAALPDRPNTLSDFTPGSDIIGFGGLGLSPADILQSPVGEDLLVSVRQRGQDVPVLTISGFGQQRLGSSDLIII